MLPRFKYTTTMKTSLQTAPCKSELAPLCLTIMTRSKVSSLSDYYDQEQGVPQEGVLSTTLFNIKFNDIVKCLGNLTDCLLYVDDFCICYCSKSMAMIAATKFK